MRRTVFFTLLLYSFLAPLLSAQDTVTVSSLDTVFRSAGYSGCFLMYNKNNNTYYAVNPARCTTAFLPASTFKIFNSMAAIDAGVVADENTVVKWDGVVRKNQNWNKDHTMREGFKNSTVWLYQYYARTIGEKRMQEFITQEHYGNENIGGGIDRFWLDGNLRISAYEQINFLRKLEAGTLHFTQRAQNICKDIMTNEANDKYTLKAKTGWSDANNDNIGWWVGYIETQGNVFFFVCNIGYPDEAPSGFLQARKEIALTCLKELGVLPR